jgi:hypothetical protein
MVSQECCISPNIQPQVGQYGDFQYHDESGVIYHVSKHFLLTRSDKHARFF